MPIAIEELAKIIAADAPTLHIAVVSQTDMEFMHEIGSLDWSFAGLLCFQRVIHYHGTDADRERLAEMNLGYRPEYFPPR